MGTAKLRACLEEATFLFGVPRRFSRFSSTSTMVRVAGQLQSLMAVPSRARPESHPGTSHCAGRFARCEFRGMLTEAGLPLSSGLDGLPTERVGSRKHS
jgi:hypothetical protein